MKYLIIYFLNYLDFLVQKKNLIVIKKYSGNKLNTYVDIGAHKGEMIDVIKNNFTVENIFAFEPNPDCLKILSKKKIKKLKIFNYALSNKEGFDYFKIGHISSMSTINSINKNSHYTKIKEKIIRVFFFKKNIYKKKNNHKEKKISSNI